MFGLNYYNLKLLTDLFPTSFFASVVNFGFNFITVILKVKNSTQNLRDCGLFSSNNFILVNSFQMEVKSMQENGLKMICMKTGNAFKTNNKIYIYI